MGWDDHPDKDNEGFHLETMSELDMTNKLILGCAESFNLTTPTEHGFKLAMTDQLAVTRFMLNDVVGLLKMHGYTVEPGMTLTGLLEIALQARGR